MIGSSYPALTAACSLGERLLNHMILALRDSYKRTPEYKHVYKKQSFDRWDIVIETLDAWGVLQHDVQNEFNELKEIRNKSIRFNHDTDEFVERDSLKAVKLIQEIVRKQFSFEKTITDWIFVETGEIYVKKEAEEIPFVKQILTKPLTLVGPHHLIDKNWNIKDLTDYELIEITDDEFCEKRKALHENRRNQRRPND